MPGLPPDLRPCFERFTRGPVLIRAALDGLDAASLNRRPPGEDWSIRDIVVHLADAELAGAVRFRLVLAGEDPPLPAYDQEAWKRRLHYLWRDPEAALSMFQQVRYSTAEMLEQCAAADWRRVGFHSERGPLTLAALLEIYAAHAEEHAAQVAAFRAAIAPAGPPSG